eukprot:6135863-Pyramimonas_sp.AAC.1
MAAGLLPLLTLSTPKPLKRPPDKVPLDPAGSQDAAETSDLGVSHIHVQLIDQPLFFFGRIDLGLLEALGPGRPP